MYFEIESNLLLKAKLNNQLYWLPQQIEGHEEDAVDALFKRVYMAVRKLVKVTRVLELEFVFSFLFIVPFSPRLSPQKRRVLGLHSTPLKENFNLSTHRSVCPACRCSRAWVPAFIPVDLPVYFNPSCIPPSWSLQLSTLPVFRTSSLPPHATLFHSLKLPYRPPVLFVFSTRPPPPPPPYSVDTTNHTATIYVSSFIIRIRPNIFFLLNYSTIETSRRL